jgi:hypothetical protein
MTWSKLALFVSGLFFGGAIDHVILALMGSDITPYGVHSGILGNWALAGLDIGLTVLLYLGHRRLEKGR